MGKDFDKTFPRWTVKVVDGEVVDTALAEVSSDHTKRHELCYLLK